VLIFVCVQLESFKLSYDKLCLAVEVILCRTTFQKQTNKQTNLDYHYYRHLDSMRIKLCSSSICGFWLPLWYLQTLLVEDHDEWSVKCNKQTGQFSMEGKLWPLLTLICDHVNLCLLIQCIFLKDVIGFPFYKKTSWKYWFCLF
jgi:hypothetical protein